MKVTALRVSLILFSQTIVYSGQDFMGEMNQQAIEESMTPVRPGIPGQQPFWNQYSMRFIYAPAFDFREVKNAVFYKFTAMSFADKKTYIFRATHPWAPLTPIWKSLPVGEVFLRVEGIGTENRRLQLSGERKFYRAAPFHGPYHSPKTDYVTSGKRQLEYIFHLDHIQQWLTRKEPDPDYVLNAYSSKMIKATIDAMLRYIEIFADESPEDCDKARVIAVKAADFIIGRSQSADAPLAFLPPTYAGDKLAARNNRGRIMLNVCAGLGQSYLDLYEVTENDKYLRAAVSIADTLLKIQLPSGVWPIKVRIDTGEMDTPNNGIPIGISAFLGRISTYQDGLQYQSASEKAWRWVLDNPLKTYNWEGQFEDVQPSEDEYRLMGMHDPCSVANYLLSHRLDDPVYLDMALEIIRFIEDQFVVWERPLPYAQRGEPTETWFTPSVLEQYTCYTPIDASVSRVAGIFYQAFEATKNNLFLEKSKALANALTRQQGSDGNIPTGWDTAPPTRIRYWWLNCALGDAVFLLNYDHHR